MKPTTFRMGAPQFGQLHKHLFPGDRDEHGAVLTAGLVETERERRFLIRDLFIARDGTDYVPGKRGYRALTGEFVAKMSTYCSREKLCYFAVHCHGGRDSVGFSGTDLQSHQRGYPALLDITSGGPVGALVFAENAVAGEIWTPTGVTQADSMTAIGLNTRRLYSEPPLVPGLSSQAFHRQSLMFGALGQHYLSKCKVGIIGLGGVGSLVNEYVARLGVGEIVVLDYDRMDHANRSRVIGSTIEDCDGYRACGRFGWLRKMCRRQATLKVEVARRVAQMANPAAIFHALDGDFTVEASAREFRDCDFIFLCADSMQARLVFNALVHQYLIPGIQMGSKVPVQKDTHVLGNVFAAARLVLPYHNGGCLWCNGLIPATKLQEEAVGKEERRRQRYVDDEEVEAPSVITLNALAAAQGVNDYLFHFLGLFDAAEASGDYQMHYPRERLWRRVELRSDDSCLQCGKSTRSIYARGDRTSLPCKSS